MGSVRVDVAGPIGGNRDYYASSNAAGVDLTHADRTVSGLDRVQVRRDASSGVPCSRKREHGTRHPAAHMPYSPNRAPG